MNIIVNDNITNQHVKKQTLFENYTNAYINQRQRDYSLLLYLEYLH